jgi:hypothetical protein
MPATCDVLVVSAKFVAGGVATATGVVAAVLPVE